MTKLLHDYIVKKELKRHTDIKVIKHILVYLDSVYDEEIDFVAKKLIKTGDIDKLIEEAKADFVQQSTKK